MGNNGVIDSFMDIVHSEGILLVLNENSFRVTCRRLFGGVTSSQALTNLRDKQA